MSKSIVKNIKALIFCLIANLIFWIILFFIQRLAFMAVNSVKAIEVDSGLLSRALLHGTIFDMSIWGYFGLLTCAIFAVFSPLLSIMKILRAMNYVVGVVGGLFAFLLPAEAITYKAWGHHVDAASLMMLADRPSLIFASAETWFEVVYVVVGIVVAIVFFGLAVWLGSKAIALAKVDDADDKTIVSKVVTSVVALVLGGLMIIPIRGGLGIAPLNTGNAYFSNNVFANHVSVNPIWNFIYSTKRAKQADAKYEFLPTDEMEARFDSLMACQDTFPRVFSVERPNVVFILLESFSAHGIEYLGGYNATPNIDSLRHTGVYFTNFFASSDRSGKGLLSVMNAYPSLPTIRVIQFPQKTQNIPSLAMRLRENGYASQTFVYGGDINFNNFNSLVNQDGFDTTITQDDFSSDQMGDKWGAHDEYTFERLLETMDKQPQPFFDFYFTLSSHEPYTVPMDRHVENDYLNSMYYTDMCLGNFMRKAREKSWWKNTVFVLVADHGHPGPDNVGVTDRKKFNIPLILTGGALAVRDSAVTTYGSQTDITATLLKQLNISTRGFDFSKNLLDPTVRNYAFFDLSDGFGFVTPDNYQVYDNEMKSFIRLDDNSATADTISGMAYLQKVAADFHTR